MGINKNMEVKILLLSNNEEEKLVEFLKAQKISVVLIKSKEELSALLKENFDMVLIDNEFKERKEVITKLREIKEEVGIFFLTNKKDEEDPIEAILTGADGIILKELNESFLKKIYSYLELYGITIEKKQPIKYISNKEESEDEGKILNGIEETQLVKETEELLKNEETSSEYAIKGMELSPELKQLLLQAEEKLQWVETTHYPTKEHETKVSEETIKVDLALTPKVEEEEKKEVELKGEITIQQNVAKLLIELWKERNEGLLIIWDTEKKRKRELFIRSGEIQFAIGEEGERLTDYLLRHHYINREDLTRLEDKIRKKGDRKTEATTILEEGFLTPERLIELIRENYEEIVYNAIGIEKGEWKLIKAEPEKYPQNILLKSHTLEIIYNGIKRRFDTEWLTHNIGNPLSTSVELEKIPTEIKYITIDHEEEKIIEYLKGQNSPVKIIEISQELNIDLLKVQSILYFISLLNGIKFIRYETSIEELESKIDENYIENKYNSILCSDYYKILETTPGATSYEIEISYKKLKGKLKELKIRPEKYQELYKKYNEIIAVIEEAYEILKDDYLRERYYKKRFSDK